MEATKQDIISQLRSQILLLQGFRAPSVERTDTGLGPIMNAFPNSSFPTGAIHEFICGGMENAAASGGFITALVGSLMGEGRGNEKPAGGSGSGVCLWISSSRTVFPAGLKAFGIEPDRVIFIDLKKEKEVLWATEEALKCGGLAAVVGELKEISFTASRRLQLAVEQSRVTGFLIRHNPLNLNTIACVARWAIRSIPSEQAAGMPGLGFPRWSVELSRVRNGQPGIWELEWSAGRFTSVLKVGETATRIPSLKRPVQAERLAPLTRKTG